MDQSDNQLPTNSAEASEEINVFVYDRTDAFDGQEVACIISYDPETTIETLLQEIETQLGKRRGEYKLLFNGVNVAPDEAMTLKQAKMTGNAHVYVTALKMEQNMSPPPAETQTTSQLAQSTQASMEQQPQQTIVNKAYKVPTKPPIIKYRAFPYRYAEYDDPPQIPPQPPAMHGQPREALIIIMDADGNNTSPLAPTIKISSPISPEALKQHLKWQLQNLGLMPNKYNLDYSILSPPRYNALIYLPPTPPPIPLNIYSNEWIQQTHGQRHPYERITNVPESSLQLHHCYADQPEGIDGTSKGIVLENYIKNILKLQGEILQDQGDYLKITVNGHHLNTNRTLEAQEMWPIERIQVDLSPELAKRTKLGCAYEYVTETIDLYGPHLPRVGDTCPKIKVLPYISDQILEPFEVAIPKGSTWKQLSLYLKRYFCMLKGEPELSIRGEPIDLNDEIEGITTDTIIVAKTQYSKVRPNSWFAKYFTKINSAALNPQQGQEAFPNNLMSIIVDIYGKTYPIYIRGSEKLQVLYDRIENITGKKCGMMFYNGRQLNNKGLSLQECGLITGNRSANTITATLAPEREQYAYTAILKTGDNPSQQQRWEGIYLESPHDIKNIKNVLANPANLSGMAFPMELLNINGTKIEVDDDRKEIILTPNKDILNDLPYYHIFVNYGDQRLGYLTIPKGKEVNELITEISKICLENPALCFSCKKGENPLICNDGAIIKNVFNNYDTLNIQLMEKYKNQRIYYIGPNNERGDQYNVFAIPPANGDAENQMNNNQPFQGLQNTFPQFSNRTNWLNTQQNQQFINQCYNKPLITKQVFNTPINPLNLRNIYRRYRKRGKGFAIAYICPGLKEPQLWKFNLETATVGDLKEKMLSVNGDPNFITVNGLTLKKIKDECPLNLIFLEEELYFVQGKPLANSIQQPLIQNVRPHKNIKKPPKYIKSKYRTIFRKRPKMKKPVNKKISILASKTFKKHKKRKKRMLRI